MRTRRRHSALPGTLALACLAAGAVAQPQRTQRNESGGKLEPDQACFDVQHYDLRLAVDPVARSITGMLTMRAKVTKDTAAIRLDLDRSLKVSAVTSGGAPVEFTHLDGRIAIPLGQTVKAPAEIQVAVTYAGVPRVAPRPPWQGGFTWKKTASGAPWIATSCQGEGADLWWPCKDHPSDKPESMDLRITVPKDLVCATNGRLLSDETDGERRHFHWLVSTPIANYTVALNIAPYEVLTKKFTSVAGDTFDTFFYCLPESLEKAKKAFPHFLDHVRHMEEVCGPYPFRADKYAVVETPHLGMEHQTIIAYGNGYKLEKDGYDWLHHHEMSHEWWANLVTARDWKDMWIHEGIGTYMQSLYMEKLRGKQGYMREMQKQALQIRNRGPIAPREVMTTQQISFSAGGNEIYMKGSWVMHTLRWLMGDEKFFVALRRMAYPDPAKEKTTDGSAVRFTDTEEIRAIAEKVHGADLSWFFEVYTRNAEVPRLVREYRDDRWHLSWDVPVEGVEFPMPVQVRVNGKEQRVAMPGGKGSFAAGPEDDVQVDPDRWILKRRTRTRGR